MVASVPSPEATGGAGAGFEATVGAVALARLLRGDRVPGLDLPPARVRFQQRVAGAVLDDVVIDAEDPRGGVRTIEYQVKRHAGRVSRNEEFTEIVTQCWRAIKQDGTAVTEGRQRFGIASAPSTLMKDLHRVTVIARAHDTPSGFLAVVRDASRGGVRDRLDALRKVVTGFVDAPLPDGTSVDQVAWRIARALYIWQVDAEPGGRDVLEACDRLTDLLPIDADADRVFGALIESARSWAPQAGSVDLGMVRLHLEQQGVALDAAPARRAAFETLQAVSRGLLDRSAARLGQRLHLPRDELRHRVLDALREHSVVVLGGRAGVGKSILARLVAADLDDAGAVVSAINLAGRTGTLADLGGELGVGIADALAGAPIGGMRVLLIDGAEQALTDGSSLLTALLAAIPSSRGTSPPWRVLLTCRDEAVGTLTRIVQDRIGTVPHAIVIDELGDDEVCQVLVTFPALEPLARNARAEALLLRRPYLIELIVRSVAPRDLLPDLVGEEDLVDLVTERLVRRDDGGRAGRGAPDARADVYLALADAVLDNAVPARLDGTEAEARAGLSSDDVLVRVRASWRFAHDVLADYAVASRLIEPDGDAVLARAAAPRRLLRAIRLRMQSQLSNALAEGTLSAVWAQTLLDADGLVARDGPRWRDLPWEALLHSGTVRNALGVLSHSLLTGDAAGLVMLLDVTERLARQPATGENTGRPLRLDLTLSAPVVDLLTIRGLQLPDLVRPVAARLVHEHLEAAADEGLAPDTGLEHASELADVLVGWAGDDKYGDLLGHVIGGLALLGHRLADGHDEFLAGHARNRPHEVAEAVESPRAGTHLARSRPDLMLRLAGLYYLGTGLELAGKTDEIGRYDDDDGDFDAEGVRDHDPQQSRHLSMWPLGNDQSNPALGPFAALLDAHPDHGLRLVLQG